MNRNSNVTIRFRVEFEQKTCFSFYETEKNKYFVFKPIELQKLT